MTRFLLGLMLLSPGVLSCKRHPERPASETAMQAPAGDGSADQRIAVVDYDTAQWTEITSTDPYILDIRYATMNNFVKEKIYPCSRMFLRKEAARALEKVRLDLDKKGYGVMLFDGYRPRPAQQKLWDKVPDRNYVAPPSEGSMHNRGVAIDLTLTDLNGNEIDMGTEYDFFGPEAHHDYLDLSKEVLQHRQLLKTVMESHGFQGIRTEWWHYSYVLKSFPLEDWVWECHGDPEIQLQESKKVRE